MKAFRCVLLVFVLSISFGMLNQSYSQVIYFCESVDADGNPIKASSNFTIPAKGGYLYVLVDLEGYQVDCSSVDFEIYRNGKYDNTISMDTKSNLTWFWKQITFYKAGEFTIDVYDCNDDLIVSGTVEIEKD